MGKRLKKDFMFLFNLVLFIQLYSSTCLESYIQNGSITNEKSKGTLQRPKRPARLMPVQLLINEDEDETPKTKNITDTRFYGPANSCAEIAKLGYTLNGYYLVKGNTTKNDRILVLGCKFKHVDGSREAKEEKVGFIDIERKSNKSAQRRSIQSSTMETTMEIGAIDDIAYRQNRPARLLPLRMILGEEKNKTRTRFYGPATSCDELEKLGYTLNGLYLVDCKDKSNKGRIEVIICRFKQPNGSKENKEERLGFLKIQVRKSKAVKRRDLLFSMETDRSSGSENFHGLRKRPGRLLPLQLFYGKEKIETEEINVVKRFYGLPSNCSELERIGYTLNGFYLVNETSNRKIEIVFCRFQQPIMGNESMKEERFELTNTTAIQIPDQFGVFIYKANTTRGLQKYKKIPLDQVDYNKIAFTVFLMNNHGKCLVPEGYLSVNRAEGVKLIQTVCNPFPGWDNGVGWSIMKGDKNGSGIRLYYYFYCISFNGILNYQSKYAEVLGHQEQECNNQNWKAVVLENGNQLASGNKCLAIEGDSAESRSFAIPAVCDAEQKGQMWSFVEFETHD